MAVTARAPRSGRSAVAGDLKPGPPPDPSAGPERGSERDDPIEYVVLEFADERLLELLLKEDFLVSESPEFAAGEQFFSFQGQRFKRVGFDSYQVTPGEWQNVLRCVQVDEFEPVAGESIPAGTSLERESARPAGPESNRQT